MAYYSILIALSSQDDLYEVVSQITADVNLLSLQADNLLIDVSEITSYLDKAAIIQKDNFAKYLLPVKGNSKTHKWYKTLPKEVKLIVVHKLEWDSGLSD